VKRLILLFVLVGCALAQAQDKPRLNVLFFMSDDLRCELGCYGVPIKTPNIDKLAAAGVRFDRAYCQFPLCNPSRSSMLNGRYPTQTGVLDNQVHFRNNHPDWITLPQYFKEHGYVTLYAGKIFHGGKEDPVSWTEDLRARAGRAPAEAGTPPDAQPKSATKKAAPRPPAPKNRQGVSDHIVVSDSDSDGDADNAAKTIRYLEQNKDRPFFIACGFFKPHSPPSAPWRFFDLYDPNQIKLPPNFAPRPTPPAGFPAESIVPNYDLFVRRDASPAQAREMIRAYRASVSWVDYNLGRVMEALDRLQLRDKTVIVVWGDNGYHLGEMGKWAKHGSLYEEGARIPLIIVAPAAKGNGQPCPRIVQTLDLYKTLADLCGLPAPAGIEGRSLAPLLQDPTAAWDHPAYTVYFGNKVLARSVRTERWRYAEWGDAQDQAMLIDMVSDPVQTRNLINDPASTQIVQQMKTLLSPLEKTNESGRY